MTQMMHCDQDCTRPTPRAHVAKGLQMIGSLRPEAAAQEMAVRQFELSPV